MEIDSNRSSVIQRMQSRIVTIDQFNFDQLSSPPLYTLLTQYDIDRLYNIANSIRYAGNINKKYKAINEVLQSRDFVKLFAGTNRVVYKHREIDSIILKTAVDSVGIQDNPSEFLNQAIFKPFVTKVFEVSPDGTVGLFERVVPITSREEFLSVAHEIYDVLSEWFIGEYVMEDVGTKFFMNWGIRKGFGPVLLDFPYCYKLDINKVYCSKPDENSLIGKCDGKIDYDDGYNFLFCTKCGAKYRGHELQQAIENKLVIERGKEKQKMNVTVIRNGVKTIVGNNEEDGVLGQATNKIIHRDNKSRQPIKATVIKGHMEKNPPEVKEEKKNMRGAVRASVIRQSADNKKESLEENQGENISSNDVVYNADQIAAMPFRLSEFDKEHGIIIMKNDNTGIGVYIDANSFDENFLCELTEDYGPEMALELEQAKSDLMHVEDDNSKLQSSLEEANREIERLKKENEDMEKRFCNEIEDNEDCRLDKSRLEDELKRQKKECSTTKGLLTRANNKIDRLNSRIEELENEIINLNGGKPIGIKEFDLKMESSEDVMAECGTEGNISSDHCLVIRNSNGKVAVTEGNFAVIITSINGVSVDDMMADNEEDSSGERGI